MVVPFHNWLVVSMSASQLVPFVVLEVGYNLDYFRVEPEEDEHLLMVMQERLLYCFLWVMVQHCLEDSKLGSIPWIFYLYLVDLTASEETSGYRYLSFVVQSFSS